MKNIILISGIAMILASCESLIIKDLEIEDTGYEQQIVVESFIESGSDSIVALVSQNESILTSTTEIKFLEDADVRLLHQGNEIAKLEQGEDGLYYNYFDDPLSATGEYEILVSNTPYQDARSRTMIPSDVEISELEFEFDVGTDALDMSSVSEVSFVINDPPGKNYYSINITTKSLGLDTIVLNSGDTIFQDRVIWVYPATTQLDPSISGSDFSDEFIINDEFFDGQRKKVTVRLILSYFTTSPGFEEEIREVLLATLTTHSEDSFKYATSLSAYRAAGDFALFSEPVSVYTNIDNGLGIFAGKSVKTYSFK